ncbi:glycosyltransferase family 2 protein [Staphylococcus simulans]|uniref:glycosyltransferase family 2 protein n=1 Tax=Staphylococcus simulans TaxID=1286 RepID=UPI00399B588E
MISVILPVYNAGDYIEECLDSLLNQTIGEENLEVILIDDASTDNSVEKIKNFKNKFTNLVLYQFKKNNGSPGKPRNKGVSLATGEFIHFMDPDDVLYKNTYEILLDNMRDKDDFVMGKMIAFNEDGSTFQHVTFRNYKMQKTYVSTKLKLVPFFAQVKVGVVLKLIRKQFYLKNEIHFVENMKNGEDKLVDTMLYTRANHFTYIPEPVYLYRNRIEDENESLTHGDINRSIKNDIEAFGICRPYFSSEELEFFKINVFRSLLWKIISEEFINSDTSYKNEVLKEIQSKILPINKQVLKLYLDNEAAIIKLISDCEYKLAIQYIELFHNRRETFYIGSRLLRKTRESKKFINSKSYKLYSLLSKYNILR